MTTTTIIQLNSEDLRAELKQIIAEVLIQHGIKEPEPPQTGGVELAMEVLNRSKSWIYKATCQNAVPHKKFGSKIIFNRVDLEDWLSQQAVGNRHAQDAIDKMLQQSASKKLK